METGIYKISFKGSDEFYIGMTAVGFKKRWTAHAENMELGIANRLIQEHYSFYGKPVFSIIQKVEGYDKIRKYERAYIKAMKPSLNIQLVDKAKTPKIIYDVASEIDFLSEQQESVGDSDVC